MASIDIRNSLVGIEQRVQSNHFAEDQETLLALTELIAQEPQANLQAVFTSQLYETLTQLETQLAEHTGWVRIAMRSGKQPESVDVPRDKITAIKFLPLPSGERLFVPVADLRIITEDTPSVRVYTTGGIEEKPGPGRWFRFKLQDVRLSFVEP